MPCTPAADWRVDARQSNDFSGTPGNVLGPLTADSVINTSLAGTCSLRFVDADPSTGTLSGQPAGTEINQPVRAVAFTPSSSQLVTVEAVDGSPAQARLTWFGEAIAVSSDPGGYSTSGTASAGLATFSDLVIPVSGNYTLAATTAAPGVATGESDPFQVIGVVEDCRPSACSAQLSVNGAKSSVTLTGTPTEGSGFALLSLNLGADPIGASGCAGYVPPERGVLRVPADRRRGRQDDRRRVHEGGDEEVAAPRRSRSASRCPGPTASSRRTGARLRRSTTTTTRDRHRRERGLRRAAAELPADARGPLRAEPHGHGGRRRDHHGVRPGEPRRPAPALGAQPNDAAALRGRVSGGPGRRTMSSRASKASRSLRCRGETRTPLRPES